MFHLWYDTRSEALAHKLAEQLATTSAANPLVPRTVLVPHLGLERWLTRTLAEEHGIAANVEFLPPAKFAWHLLRAWQPELPQRSAFDREVLQWRLFDLLPEVAAANADLAELLTGVQPELRRLQLAGRLAHLFERYQAYRPDLLNAWATEEARGAQKHSWQRSLWRALVDADDEAPRSRLMQDFIAHFGYARHAPPGLPSTLFAYGCINVSPPVLEMLFVAAQFADTHFYMPTPCREYWGDLPHRRDWADYLQDLAGLIRRKTDEPNRLLVSLGGVGREFVVRVFTNERIDIRQSDADTEAEDARGTLLERLQADIRGMGEPDPDDRLAAPEAEDRSIQIHACHSPLREVQVLHDRLLDLLANDPSEEKLQPRDIVVMTPDVSRYAAAVEAVFGALDENDPRYLPWTVSDRARADGDPLISFFVSLLSLPATRLTLDYVLEAMDVPALRNAAGIDGEDLEILAEKARDAGIRWGDDAAARAAEGLPAFDDFSWAFGRRRLLLGYMLGDDAVDPDSLDLVEGVAPASDIEGQMAQGFGALRDLQRQLHQLKTDMDTPRSPADWQSLFNRFLGRLLRVERDDRAGQRALAEIRKALSALAGNAEAAGFAGTLDWQGLRELLSRDLADERVGQRYLDGGVSVCSMVPMRDVPFKVVCVLGLDADAFPRRDEADALSLIKLDAENHRLGDRSVRDDDRYLFLQTIMAARQHLYLSYVGIDPASGKDREPSVLLAELITQLVEGYFVDAKAARKALVTRQPMHPFSPQLFPKETDEVPYFTYRGEWLQAAGQTRGGTPLAVFADQPVPRVDDALPWISLQELQQFFAAPQKTFLMRSAGIGIDPLDERAGREPQVLNGLQNWQLQQALLPPLLAEPSPDAGKLRDAMRARALLPPLALGDATLADQRRQIEPPVRQWQQWVDGAGRGAVHRFEMTFDGLAVLHGAIDGVYERGFAGWVGRNGSHKRWFAWWLRALVHAAELDQGEAEYRAFGINKKDEKPRLPVAVAMPEPDEARARLRELVEIMLQGLASPLRLPPRSGWDLARTLVKPPRGVIGDDAIRERALDNARRTWEGNDHNAGERQDPWVAIALRGEALWDAPEPLLEAAEESYVPLWQSVTGEGRDDD